MRVVIVGAGIVGSACALALTEAGADVVVVDRTGVAGETSSRCEGNILVSDKGPGAEAELAVVSNRMWRELAARLDADRAPGQPATEFDAKGGVVAAFAENDGGLRAFAAAQQSAGIRAEVVDAADLPEYEPHLSRDVTVGVHYPDDAQVQPSLAAQALMGRARRLGARLCIAEVIGVTITHGAVRGIRTTESVIGCDAVVNCAGPWSGEVARLLGVSLDIRPRRGTIIVTTPMPLRIVHKVYDADYVGAVASGDAALQTSTVVESTLAGTVLIGSSRERVGFSEEGTLPALAEIAGKATRLFPFLRDTMVLRTYAGFRPYAPDHLPVIGADPRVAGVFHAAGHEGAGIGLAPATAALIAHAVLGASPPLDPTPYLPTRASLQEVAA